MTQVGVPQGVVDEFRVVQHYGVLPDGDVYVCNTVASKGNLLFETAEGVASITSGNLAAAAKLLGFVEQNVVADLSQSIEFGYAAQQKTGSSAGDFVTLHRFGRFYVTAVSGSIAVGATVYPADNGKIAAAQVGAAPRLGRCYKANAAPGGAVEIEINLIGV